MSIVDEIASYLRHQDYSLVVRRMLDLSFDTNDDSLMRKVIEWSKHYRKQEMQAAGSGVSTAFLEEADQLLQSFRPKIYTSPTHPVSLISAKDVSKTYSKGNFSLKPISLGITSGEIVGIVGENGNGKTTLLRCLAGQLALDSGIIEHSQLKNPDNFDIRKYVAFIPQRIPRWYGMLKDNLHFSASISGTRREKNELMVDFMLERLNLTNYANLNWNQISSGYRTRFEIARILLQQPRLLILDEPLANLDINAQQTFLTDLRFLTKSSQNPMGVILSSQQLHEVEKIADSVLFIKQGACLYQSNTTASSQETIQYVIELETSASRESIVTILQEDKIQIQYNGGYYTISSPVYTTQEMIGKLVQNSLPVTYFRDITHSTKRFF